MVQRHETAVQLFVSHEQLAESIEPAMADLNDPAPRFLSGVASFGFRFPLAIHHMRDVTMSPDGLQRGLPAIAGVCT